MRLVTAQVVLFRNVLDSTPVPIEPDITCLVGKNESGKTAFLHVECSPKFCSPGGA
jgi:recombinational DNA repair ATPase RecF